MARPRRRSSSPAARTSGVASRLTLLWLATAVGVAYPLLLSRTRTVPSVNLVVFAAFGVLALVAWWWALRVARWQNAAGKRLEELKALSPDAFEEWVAARFRDRGYRVELTGAQGDHGVDLLVRTGDERAVVQVKNYRATSVGEPILRDLFEAMHHAGAARAYLVTTGRLTQPPGPGLETSRSPSGTGRSCCGWLWRVLPRYRRTPRQRRHQRQRRSRVERHRTGWSARAAARRWSSASTAARARRSSAARGPRRVGTRSRSRPETSIGGHWAALWYVGSIARAPARRTLDSAWHGARFGVMATKQRRHGA